MALPVNEKTWQHVVNQVAAADDNTMLLAIKNAMKAMALGGWTVWGSSDSVACGNNDGVDRWLAVGNLVHAAGAHSWIVLKQPGIHANFQVCIDLVNVTTYYGAVVVSPTLGFVLTPGTTSARPTAADEVVLVNGSTYLWGTTYPKVWHLQVSEDGECTRLLIFQGNNAQCVAMFEKPKSPLAAWAVPAVFRWKGSASNICSFAEFSDAAGWYGYQGGSFTLYTTAEGYIDGTLGEKLTVPDDWTGEWPMLSLGLAGGTAPHRGRKGQLYDMWFGSTGMGANVDAFPGDGSRTFACFKGCLILPWDGSVPLTA